MLPTVGPYLERGDMVVFGPILTEDDSYGLAVVETDDEQARPAVGSASPPDGVQPMDGFLKAAVYGASAATH